MRRSLLLTLSVAALCAAPADAAIRLLGRGVLSGTTDKSGLTGTLENGLPGNILGGLGSGIAYAGGTTFLAVPDRGPNATPYNSQVDDTASYIARFQTLRLALKPSAAGAALPFTLNPVLTRTTLLSSRTALTYGTGAGLGTKIDGTPLGSGAPAANTASAHYFTGRSDNYGPGNSGVPTDARFDPESIRLSNDHRDVFISDEYGPYVREFNRFSGKLVRTYTLPTNLDVSLLSPNGATEISGNTVGRVANKGMEGLALTPDGKTLYGIMQAPLEQDAGVAASAKLLRIVTIDVATGATKAFGYKLTTGSGVSEIVAINSHEFLVDERDGKGLGDGSNASVKQFFTIDTNGAVDITALSGAAAAAATGVTKSASPFVDLVSVLLANGFTKATIPAKIEGLAFGQDVVVDGVTTHTLFVANDNDFLPTYQGTPNPNQFFVIGFTDADLPRFESQQFSASVPEPTSWALMIGGFGLIGGALRRRAVSVA